MSRADFTCCERCGNAIPCFSIEWSELHDEDKCRCPKPIFPESPLSKLFRFVFGRKA